MYTCALKFIVYFSPPAFAVLKPERITPQGRVPTVCSGLQHDGVDYLTIYTTVCIYTFHPSR